MIISHKHKFIFMKTRKTAGTSVQETLTSICGEDDIITPDVDTVGRNIDKSCWEGHPHPHLFDVKQLVGNDIWNEYFKFVFVRNPFDLTVSRFFWNINGKGQKGYGLTKSEFNRWVDEFTSSSRFHDARYYSINLVYPFLIDKNFVGSNHSMINYDLNKEHYDVDFVGRYESLQDDFNHICDTLNVDRMILKNKKTGNRPKKSFKDMYTAESINKIGYAFKEDLELLGYNYEQELTLTKKSILIDRNIFKNEDININGASLIKIPEWVKNPLGKYYLYFANHTGKYIRLAYSDDIMGPYEIYKEGTLKLNQTNCKTHIASPDVHLNSKTKQIIMYYHGDTDNGQKTFISNSSDGINFVNEEEPLGLFYFRVFSYKDKYYAIAKNKNDDSLIYQSNNFDKNFKPIFNLLPNSRHTAVLIKNNFLYVFYTIVGETPESIYYCKVKLDDKIDEWEVISNHKIARPNFKFEGAGSNLIPSNFGSATLRYGNLELSELRDPCIYEENDKIYLLYTFSGEAGIAIGRINVNE